MMDTNQRPGRSSARSARSATTISRAAAPRAAVLAAVVLAAVVAALAHPAAAVTTTIPITGRVGVGPGNAQLAAGTIYDPLLDATGRYAFFTTAQGIVAADTNAALDVYRKDRLSGGVQRVSLMGEATQINAKSALCGASSSGRYVTFQTTSATADLANQIWRRDLVAGTTTRVTAAGSGASGSVSGTECPVSDDGNRVAFTSAGSGLGCGSSGEQVILRRIDTNVASCMSVSTGGDIANAKSGRVALSGSGDVVAFVSSADNLVSGDTNSTYDVFLRQISTNTTTRITKPGGAQLDGDSQSPSLSATGRYVAFTSNSATIVPDDDNATRDVFRLDRQTSTFERVSVSTGGVEGNGYSTSPSISGDGAFVAFESDATNLYPADGNGDTDIFRHDITLGRTDLASRVWNGISAGNGVSWHGPAISDDGRVVAFESGATNLVPNDTNGAYDTFVRDFALDIAPFGSAKAFAKQQLLDFGGAVPSSAALDAAVTTVTSGAQSPDGLVLAQARSATWTAKRSPLIRLYWAFFLRAPDPSGMTYWTNQLTNGKTLAQVAAKFAQSSEFQTKYGSKTNEQFVTLIYQNIFEREPDPAGLAYWTGKLDAGTKTRGDVMTNFSESSEGKRFLAPQVDTINVWLGMLRTMPPKAELAQWIADIRDGAPAEEVAQHVRTLPAYAARVTA